MRAPLMKITIGDYFYRLPGLIESINITIDDNVPWEIENNQFLKQLPHVINVQCNFKPIQDFLPRRERISRLSNVIPISDSSLNISNVPYITDSKGYYVSIDDTQGEIINNPKVIAEEPVERGLLTNQQSLNANILQNLSNRTMAPTPLNSISDQERTGRRLLNSINPNRNMFLSQFERSIQ
jgi:hypothetical protein